MSNTLIKIQTRTNKKTGKTFKLGKILDLETEEVLYTAEGPTHAHVKRELRKSNLIPTNVIISKKETIFTKKN
ncbi:hypothetical protein A2331_05295 [Candidatus Falkowbacteria bacterium RIFOXYB2_FULL_34_18]|uniref:Uncharacterized protein n=1 Tax=Candidatus Falkowbacteria bacterium RIFOXYD2_FULL_34_120 TaxID=1798007 RepID=A0A1F5TQM2_9BACT|nr:MAG: hypothetical protein A2331_05295 [Candidatus Falkowbacteria bacterium RIFOXYB2_FULL_34_18]OGF29470.1 MAG: hypothetical protein A2500_04160 [Candidatus Falkowbacteria bacterium RIFOXYC12_FULL_34_55]OGF36287.1 MAG: hypothetical protein A2466_05170 [Candidatus Falkowbacteria bacterium RIFOXYC2_FULL_34_220]OGF38996.1 MAG: hypothetical protein A2515_06625 [Candidatus Falkowbacteria bacterium RIFOXYD12_FULL_34_57]OGF41215.1 MAG: hypothetical protein A2531_00865 [Candidatus Falkowbacteria bact